MQEQVEAAFPGWSISGETLSYNRWVKREGFHLRIAKNSDSEWFVSDMHYVFPEAVATNLLEARNKFFLQVQCTVEALAKTFAPVPDPQLGPQWVHEPGSTLWTLKYAGGVLRVLPLSSTHWKAGYDAGPHGGQGYGATAQEALEDLRGAIEDRMKDLLEEKDAHGAALEALACLNK